MIDIGDIISKIDNQSVKGLELSQVVQMIVGASGSTVEVEILRAKEMIGTLPSPVMVGPFRKLTVEVKRKSAVNNATTAGLGILFHKVCDLCLQFHAPPSSQLISTRTSSLSERRAAPPSSCRPWTSTAEPSKAVIGPSGPRAPHPHRPHLPGPIRQARSSPGTSSTPSTAKTSAPWTSPTSPSSLSAPPTPP
jgi:hypothetical protein